MATTWAWAFLFLLAPAIAWAADPSLEDKIAPLVKAHRGKATVALQRLGTAEAFYFNADTPMPTASLIKVAVMVAAYREVDAGRARLNDLVSLQEGDKVPGSGILTKHFSPGVTLPLRDAIRLMIAYSDNTATNMVLDHIGIRTVNDTMTSMGFPNTLINAKVFKGSTTSVSPQRTKDFGLGSTTARESINLLEKIDANRAASPSSCKEMIAHLKACESKDLFPRNLPAGTVLAHKTGAVNQVRTSVGILYLKSGPILLCVMTSENQDQRWTKENEGEILCARIAKLAFDHFQKEK